MAITVYFVLPLEALVTSYIGKRLICVDKFFASSQTCSNCGYVNKGTKDLKIRAWDCPQCGTHHDRDVNAAINIRNEGMRIVLA